MPFTTNKYTPEISSDLEAKEYISEKQGFAN